MFSKINPIRNRRRRRRNERTGATAVEFALIAPTFIFIIVLCIEFARLSMLRNTAHNACYESCRFLITDGATVADGRERAQSILNRLGDIQATILVNGADGSADSEGNIIGELGGDTDTVQTEISIPLANNTLVLPGNMFGSSSIQARMSMQTERSAGFFNSADIN